MGIEVGRTESSQWIWLIVEAARSLDCKTGRIREKECRSEVMSATDRGETREDEDFRWPGNT